ncbi:DUF4375 domain-containing protein [Paracoccus aurantiacus]|nr:DUF4375 domain-containing protein [Paracoccus aurantiacus]
MILRTLTTLSLCLFAATANAQSGPIPADCQPGPHLRFPVPAALMHEAHTLASLLSPAKAPDPDSNNPAQAIREVYRDQQNLALMKLQLMPPEQRDIVLLSALYDYTMPPNPWPVTMLATEVDDRFLEQFLDSLNRRDLSDHSGTILVALVAFSADAEGSSNGPATVAERKRYLAGELATKPSPGFLKAMDEFNYRLSTAAPMLMVKAGEIVAANPDLAKQRETVAGTVESGIYAGWALTEIIRCAGDWQARADQANPFADMPPNLRDLALIQVYKSEAAKGGIAQYIRSRAGAMAPELYQAMQRWNLVEPAAQLTAAMQLLGQPYPTDQTARIAAWDGSNGAADPVFNEDMHPLDLEPRWDRDFAQQIQERLNPQP